MKDRIRFISHKGKRILLVDATDCSPEELVELLPNWFSPGSRPKPKGSVLLLADFSGVRRLTRRAWRLLSRHW